MGSPRLSALNLWRPHLPRSPTSPTPTPRSLLGSRGRPSAPKRLPRGPPALSACVPTCPLLWGSAHLSPVLQQPRGPTACPQCNSRGPFKKHPRASPLTWSTGLPRGPGRATPPRLGLGNLNSGPRHPCSLPHPRHLQACAHMSSSPPGPRLRVPPWLPPRDGAVPPALCTQGGRGRCSGPTLGPGRGPGRDRLLQDE